MNASIRPRIELVKEAPPVVPDEPTGVGAVVEIIDDPTREPALWVRTAPSPSWWTRADAYGEHGKWKDITRNKLVRVLSPGWSPSH